MTVTIQESILYSIESENSSVMLSKVCQTILVYILRRPSESKCGEGPHVLKAGACLQKLSV